MAASTSNRTALIIYFRYVPRQSVAKRSSRLIFYVFYYTALFYMLVMMFDNINSQINSFNLKPDLLVLHNNIISIENNRLVLIYI